MRPSGKIKKSTCRQALRGEQSHTLDCHLRHPQSPVSLMFRDLLFPIRLSGHFLPHPSLPLCPTDLPPDSCYHRQSSTVCLTDCFASLHQICLLPRLFPAAHMGTALWGKTQCKEFPRTSSKSQATSPLALGHLTSET